MPTKISVGGPGRTVPRGEVLAVDAVRDDDDRKVRHQLAEVIGVDLRDEDDAIVPAVHGPLEPPGHGERAPEPEALPGPGRAGGGTLEKQPVALVGHDDARHRGRQRSELVHLDAPEEVDDVVRAGGQPGLERRRHRGRPALTRRARGARQEAPEVAEARAAVLGHDIQPPGQAARLGKHGRVTPVEAECEHV